MPMFDHHHEGELEKGTLGQTWRGGEPDNLVGFYSFYTTPRRR